MAAQQLRSQRTERLSPYRSRASKEVFIPCMCCGNDFWSWCKKKNRLCTPCIERGYQPSIDIVRDGAGRRKSEEQ